MEIFKPWEKFRAVSRKMDTTRDSHIKKIKSASES